MSGFSLPSKHVPVHRIQGIPPNIYTKGILAFLPVETAPANIQIERLLELKYFFSLSFSQLGQWKVKSCEEKLKYVCKKKGEVLNETKSDEGCSLEEVIERLYFSYRHFGSEACLKSLTSSTSISVLSIH